MSLMRMGPSPALNNKKHYGFGHLFFDDEDNYNSIPSTWEPKPLQDLAKETALPILRFSSNPRKSGNYLVLKRDGSFSVDPSSSKNNRGGHDLIKLVQQWIKSKEAELLKCEKAYEVIPIICHDKAIRYARTGEQRFGKNAKGYSIQVRLIPSSDKGPRDDDNQPRYYYWSVAKTKDDAFNNVGIMFELHVFEDFYKKREKLEKNFDFFSVTSFDCVIGSKIYRFFCIGEIDGVQQLIRDSYGNCDYIPLEVKSSAATEDNFNRSPEDIFNRYKLPQYYAKCAVSQVPKVVIGMQLSKLKSSGEIVTAATAAGEIGSQIPTVFNYQEIRVYSLNDCPHKVLKDQENNLSEAINTFHENIKGAHLPKYLNGCKKVLGIEVYFQDNPRSNN